MFTFAAFTLLLQVTSPMIELPAGQYRPLYGRAADLPTSVAAFRLDRDPVTRGEFLGFVRRHPEWRRSAVGALFADRRGYLADWRGDTDAGDATELNRPVAGVSWFAARAYCAERAARLPSVAEWEYAASASAGMRNAARDKRFVQELVSAYATRPAPRVPAFNADVNVYGLRGMHEIGWEWVEDFNSVMVSDDSRGAGSREHSLFCASAAIGAVDPTNYPAFLRYAMRAGLTGRSTLETLGFRCAA